MVLTLLAVAMTTTACTSHTEAGTGLLTEFEYLGCAGDWNEDTLEPEATSSGTRDAATFLVRNPATCGFEYRARFLISGLPADVAKVRVNGDNASLKGDLIRTSNAPPR